MRGRTVRYAIPVTMDQVYLAVGHAGITLKLEGFGEEFPPALEAHLIAQLVSRATAARARYPKIAS